MGYGNDKKAVTEDEVHDAMKPVSMPLPKLPASDNGVDVATDRAPTMETIVDPQKPSMRGVDSTVIVDSLSGLVDDLYSAVLIPALTEMKPTLAEVAPPQKEEEWVWKLIGVAVQIVSTATVSELGAIAVKAIGRTVPALSKAAADASSSLSKDAGKAAGSWVESRAATDATHDGSPELERPIMPDGSLVDDYVKRVRNQLLVKKRDAIDTLRIIKASAVKQNPQALETIDGELRTALATGRLEAWFREKVAIEWSNFLARLSLGPRPQAQATNMVGANTIGGWHEAGTSGVAQWRGSHDGFVEIIVDVASGSPVLASAEVDNHPGVGRMLSGLGHEQAPSGQPYSFATLPMFRRVWLRTGDSKLETTPAFVMTPEGALEVNYDDPLLARLGGGAVSPSASPYDPMPDAKRNQNAWSERGARAAYAMAGADRIVKTAMTNSADVRRLRGRSE